MAGPKLQIFLWTKVRAFDPVGKKVFLSVKKCRFDKLTGISIGY